MLSSKDTGPLVAASQSRSAVHIMYLARTWGYSEYSERGSQTQDLEMRNQDFRSRKIERGVFLSICSASFGLFCSKNSIDGFRGNSKSTPYSHKAEEGG